MEDNGARSNPRLRVELGRLSELHGRLLREAATDPKRPRSAPPKVSPVLETVTLVLDRADRPMPAAEIHTAANELLGRPLRWSSVKGILSAYTLTTGVKIWLITEADRSVTTILLPEEY